MEYAYCIVLLCHVILWYGIIMMRYGSYASEAVIARVCAKYNARDFSSSQVTLDEKNK